MVILGMGVLGLMLAYFNVASIRIIAWFASTIIAASWGYVSFASVWSKKLTERGAYAAMVGGFVGYLVCQGLKELAGVPLKNFYDPFFIGVLISVIGAYWGSKGQIQTQKEIAFRESLHILPESEKVQKDYRIDRRYGWFIIVSGIVISVILIRYWAIPYNEIIGNALFTITK